MRNIYNSKNFILKKYLYNHYRIKKLVNKKINIFIINRKKLLY